MRFITRLTLLSALLTPLTAFAASMSVPDTIAGLQTEVTLSGFAAGSTVDVSVQTPDGYGFEQTVSIDTSGRGLAVVSGSDTERAGRYMVTAGNASASFDVLPDRFDTTQSSITTQTSSIDPDGSDIAIVEVRLRDKFGNPLADRPVTLIPSRTEDVVVPQEDATDENGVQRFQLATTRTGVITLRAMDLLSGIILDSSTQISAGGAAVGNAGSLDTNALSQLLGNLLLGQVGGGVISKFELTIPSAMEVDKEASTITVRAVDRNGNTVENYTGTVKFTSSDPAAALPNFGTYVFKERDLGKKDFPLVLKFRAPGKQTVRVEDSQNSTIFGEASTTVTGKGSPQAGTITITSPRNGQTLGGTDIVVQGTGPALINIIVKGGSKTMTGDTDQNGRFSVSVPVSATAEQVIFTVEDDEGRYTSEPVTIRLDASEPAINTVTFNPAKPETGTQTLVVVKTEPDLQSVTMTLTKVGGAVGQPLQLQENPAVPGSYQAFFTAPDPGAYQAQVQTTDAIGNTGKVLTNLTVDPQTLPVVRGLRGEAKSDAVTLEWNAVSVDVDGYRIYVGESDDDFLYTLDTNTPQTKATVKGLLPGQRYVFAVTAVRGKQESTDRSSPVAIETVGLRLTVTPQDTALQLDWTGVPPSLPLQSYLLEYGVQEDTYSERRILNGQAESFAMRDLLNGVAYFIRLTPITVTGEKRDDLAVKGAATPNGNPVGFNPSAGDPVPGELEPFIGPGHEGAPSELETTGFGGTLWMPAAGLALLLCGGYLYRRQRQLQTQAFLEALARRGS